MEQDDLTCLKHIGSSRKKILNDFGITTIKQLHDIPFERLAQVKSIGDYYARMIKSSVSDYYSVKNNTASKISTPYGNLKTIEINQDLKKKLKRLRKILNRVNENFKPLWEKKYLILYVDFKKRLTKLGSRLITLVRMMEDIPDEDKTKIIEKTDALILTLKKAGKKPKKKNYKATILAIQSYSKYLKDLFSEY